MTRSTRAAWSERVKRWKASGLTARQFAARERLNGTTLRWWASALRRSSPKTPGFIEVALPAAPARSPIAIVIRESVRVEVSGAFDVELLRSVVAALESR